MKILVPIIISREGKWFVASSPVLDIATQGRTEEEVKENMADLINEYFKDPDTPKPPINTIMEISMTNIPVDLPRDVLHSRASPITPK